MGQCGDGGGGGRGGFGPNDLAIAPIGQHFGLVLAIAGVNQEIESAIIILQFSQEIGLPFDFLHDVALAVAAFGQAEIIQVRYAGENVGGEHEMMDKERAVDCVFAVITGIVMPAGNFDFPAPHKGIEAGGGVFEGRRGMARFVGRINGFAGYDPPSVRKICFRQRDSGEGDMARAVSVPRKRQHIVGPAPLMVHAQRVGPRQSCGHRFTDPEWIGGPELRNQ